MRAARSCACERPPTASEFEKERGINPMEALRAALREAPDARLDVAALEIASIETPDLDAEPFLAVLDRMASTIAARLPSGAPGREFVGTANHYLFDELGFHGNEMDYN